MADRNQSRIHHLLNPPNLMQSRQTDFISPTPLRINVSYQQHAEENGILIQHQPQAQSPRRDPCTGCQACAGEPHSAECRVYFTDYEPSRMSSAPAATEDARPQFPGNGVYVRPDANEPDYYPVSTSDYTPPGVSTPATPPFREAQSPTSPLLGGTSPSPAPRSPTSPFASPPAQYWGSPLSAPQQSPPAQSPEARPLAQHWGSPPPVPQSPSYTSQSAQPNASVFFPLPGGNHGFYPAPSVERDVPNYSYGSVAQRSFWPSVNISEMDRPAQASPDLYGASPPRQALPREESPDLYGASPPRATVQCQESPDLYGASPPRQALPRQESPDLYGASPPRATALRQESPDLYTTSPRRNFWPNDIPVSAPRTDNQPFRLPSPAVQAHGSYNAWPQYTTVEESNGSSWLRLSIEHDEPTDDEPFRFNKMAVDREVSSSPEIKEEDISEESTMPNIPSSSPSPARSVIIDTYDSIDIAPPSWPSPTREASTSSSSLSPSPSPFTYEDGLPLLPTMRLSPTQFPLTAAYQRQHDRLEARIRNLKTRNGALKNDNRVLKNTHDETSARVRNLQLQCARLEAEQRDGLHMHGRIIGLEREATTQRERAERVAGAYERQRQELFTARTSAEEMEVENEGLRERIRHLESDARLRQEIRLRSGIQIALEQTASRERRQRGEIERLEGEVETLRETNGWLSRRLEEMGEMGEMEEAVMEEQEDHWFDAGVSAGMSRAMGAQMDSLTLEGTRRGEEQ